MTLSSHWHACSLVGPPQLCRTRYTAPTYTFHEPGAVVGHAQRPQHLAAISFILDPAHATPAPSYVALAWFYDGKAGPGVERVRMQG